MGIRKSALNAHAFLIIFFSNNPKGYSMFKKIIIGLFGVLILLGGLALVCYPFISNYLMGLNHASEITQQEAAVKELDDDVIHNAFKDAKKYNKNLVGVSTIADPFDTSQEDFEDLDDKNLLNVNNDSIMGNIEIPKINVNLPIFHGASQEVLLKGIGHLTNTSLPVGGKSTHAVLTGHTGVSNASLFTDLDKLVLGDMFFINVLDRTLAYEVDQIKVVRPTQKKDLLIEEGKDYVTLITCTPYGVNSHRLLVRGRRVHYGKDEIEEIINTTETVESTWMAEYKRALIIGATVLSAIVVVFIVLRIALFRRRKKKSNTETN